MNKIYQRLRKVVYISCLASVLLACTWQSTPSDNLRTGSQLLTSSSSSSVNIDEWSSSSSLPCNDVLELTFRQDKKYANNFFDVSLSGVFTSPNGKQDEVQGFYYGADLWKIRFRPDEPGNWRYAYTLSDLDGLLKNGGGSFDCTPSNSNGPVYVDKANPYRWVFANGKPYFPIGLQECGVVKGDQPQDLFIDGEKRNDQKARQVSLDEYFSIYGQAGFNLFRFSQQNCSYKLYDDLDHYREAESIATDKLLIAAREHGFRVMFGFFGFYKRPITLFDRELTDKEKRFVRYCVARWGVYADFWELLNESKASDRWTAEMGNYLRSIDPDQKPISTSYPKPYLPAIDINSPHWYESESELDSDLRVQEQASKWKKAGKPVIVGEQGNTGMNWDPLSGLRMRIRTWTALFQEISFIFWNTSWAKNGMFQGEYRPAGAANIYLGPEERGYIRVLQDFSSQLDPDMHMFMATVSSPGQVRAYGLISSTKVAVYLHHYENHRSAVDNLKITLDIPENQGSRNVFLGEWIDPASGDVVAKASFVPGQQTLQAPPFTVDLALLITPSE